MLPLVVFTVGHSTRTIDEFVHLLKAHGIVRDQTPLELTMALCVSIRSISCERTFHSEKSLQH